MSSSAALIPRDTADGWREKYEQLRKEFDEFYTESKDLEHELDTQLEQSQQDNKRLEGELSLLKRQFADLRVQKSAADAEHLRNTTQLRNSHDEAQQKVQQQATYIARIETETDELSTHKRVLEQSVRDYAEKVETLEEQRAMLETQLLIEKSSRDETIQRLHDRVRELAEDIQARIAASNTAADTPNSTEAVSGDSGFTNRINSTPLRPTPQSAFTHENHQNNINKRSRPSPVGISPSSMTYVGDQAGDHHHRDHSYRNGAIKSPRYSAYSPEPQQLVESTSSDPATPQKSPFVRSELNTNDVFMASPEKATATDADGEKHAVNSSSSSKAQKNLSFDDDTFTAANDATTDSAHMLNRETAENNHDNIDDENDHGYSSTPTSDKQRNNTNKAHGMQAAAAAAAAVDDADMNVLPVGGVKTSASSLIAGGGTSSGHATKVSGLQKPQQQQQQQLIRNSLRKTMDARTIRTGSIDENYSQHFGRKSLVADPNKIHRLLSLSGGVGGVPLSVVQNIEVHASAKDPGETAADSSSTLSTDTNNSCTRSQQINTKVGFTSRLPPPPQSSSSSNIAAPVTANNNSVHVSWFRSMQIVDKALLRLNSLEKNVKQNNNGYGINNNNGSTYHFTSTTEKMKISSSPDDSRKSGDGAAKNYQQQQHLLNHVSHHVAAVNNVKVDAVQKKQRSATENIFAESRLQQLAATAVNNPAKINAKSGIVSAVYAASNTNAGDGVGIRPPSSQLVNAGKQRTVSAKINTRSKLAAPLPPPVQQRASSSSSQSSTLSSMSSKVSEQSFESDGSTSIPAPSKLGMPVMRQANGDGTGLRQRIASAPAVANLALKTMLPPAVPPVGVVKSLRPPSTQSSQLMRREDEQQLRQPVYQQANTNGSKPNGAGTKHLSSVAHAKQHV